MHKFTLYENGISAGFYIDPEADAGIRKVADTVLSDFTKVTSEHVSLQSTDDLKGEYCVAFAQYGKSSLLSRLEQAGLISLSEIKDKWEVYGYYVLDHPFPDVKKLLVIAGSDKRGTIYGMFRLSEIMGVSPLCYWGDAVIAHKEELVITLSDCEISKEPSVKYRGFFINDEWPCFGNWSAEHFGGFTAKAYEHVFELLLRLKGNYMWPAMWSSSFALDGPGTASAELADLYGIVIGNSHHEPCLRASEEWDKVRGEDSIYGNAWNFRVNKEGLLRYWEDGLNRSAGWESIVTVGMRGERDSKVLGENATLKDNIDLLKDIIHCQKELIRAAEKRTGKQLPMLLALYKEVEPFYYGDKDTEGLCDWDELQDVILMLCEDNYGYTRTLPDEKMKQHPAGFGMYYHFDYHGSPISYEWINSTPLSKVWEQMSQAYDYNVRQIWIVNVGDLKHVEFPLSYFMNLAYDFEKYGTEAPNSQREYTLQFLNNHFGGKLSKEQIEEAEWLLSETVRLNGMRRPEALNDKIYHPCHYQEAERMLQRAHDLSARMKCFLDMIPSDAKDACYSLFGFQAYATANLLKLHLYAGMNHLRAEQGRKETNKLADLVRECIATDKKLAKEWAEFKNGKWSGMELASHIGFTKWNEDGCKYPVVMEIEPFGRPRMQVTASDDERVYDKVYGAPMVLRLDDFLYGSKEAIIEVANTGVGELQYRIDMPECSFLSVDKKQGVVTDCERVCFRFDESLLTEDTSSQMASITDGDTTVNILIQVARGKRDLPAMTFVTGKDGFVIDACHYCAKKEPEGCRIQLLDDYGIVGSGIKAYPDTYDYAIGKEPSVSYKLYTDKTGEYTCELWFAPTNPPKRNGELVYGLRVNAGSVSYENTVPSGYQAGEAVDRVWSYGALAHRRICKQKITLTEGINEIEVLLKDAGLVLERILVYEVQKTPRDSYLGPQESLYQSLVQ